jgi:carbon monoxide dehydrogenase subunit G
MLVEGKFTLQAPIQEVWDTLFDMPTLVSCIPGAEKIEAVDETTYDAIVKQKVGPITVRLKFTTTLTEVDPPRHVAAVGHGEDMSKLGTFTHKMAVDLTETSKDNVEVSYSTNVSMVGRLGTFGERIMRAKTKEIGDEITKNLQEKLTSGTARSDKAVEA